MDAIEDGVILENEHGDSEPQASRQFSIGEGPVWCTHDALVIGISRTCVWHTINIRGGYACGACTIWCVAVLLELRGHLSPPNVPRKYMLY